MNRRSLVWAALIPWTVQADAPKPDNQTDLKAELDQAVAIIVALTKKLETVTKERDALRESLSVDRNCASNLG